MGRTGQLLLGLTAAAVAASGVGIVLAQTDQPLAQAATTVVAARGAVVVSPNGHLHAAVAGMRLATGDLIGVGRSGRAILATRSRLDYLSARSVVAIVDGGHQQLRTGNLVVDAQRGPGLRLDMAGDTVTVSAGSAVEAERSVIVQVAALAGRTVVTGPSGARSSVAALYQTSATGDAVSTTPQPLQLRDDAAEAAAVPNLVADDESMRSLATGIDNSGSATAQLVDASWHGSTGTVGTGAAASEVALPILMADATSGGSPQSRYDEAVGWRRDGGSWGVVLHLLGGRGSAVLASLAGLDRTGPTSTSTVALGTGVRRQERPVQSGGTGRHVTTSPPKPDTSHQPRTTHRRKQHPSPKPGSGGVVGGLVGTTGKVLGGLLGLLPTPPAGAGAGHTGHSQSALSSLLAP